MKKLFTYLLFLLVTNSALAQIESGLLFGLTKGTTAEINAITGMEEGQILYNVDTKALLIYNGSSWINTENSNWLLDGNTAGNGSFLGTSNDVLMDIRSNNTSILQFGRRQTLGLTQNYPDYDNPNQYVIQVKGSNGTSALQFQADAASFYKPMFFTNADGNFRLKGSAAGTDFFEIGSNGTNNAGEVEFIIGDDGAEPFIFKRFDYRDGLLKELMRVQGSSDSQNALPRMGINTGRVATSTLEVNGSIASSILNTNSNITLNETHHTIIVNGNNGISLPSANTCEGRVYVIKNTSTNSISISSYLNLMGTNSTTISKNSSLFLQSDGSNWHKISSESSNPISNDTNNSIKPGTDGGAFLAIPRGARFTNTDTSTNLNAGTVLAPVFGSTDYNDDATNLYVATSNALTILEAGRYDIRATLSLLGINSGPSSQRTNVNARITVNGNPVGALSATGYIRFAVGHEQSSLHINEILQLSANDIIRIQTYREANSGIVNFSAVGESSFNINKLK